MPHGRGEPALELVVVVAVEQVVLAIVLVVQHQLDAAQPPRQLALAPARPSMPAAIGVAAPGEPGPGEVAVVLPAALVDQRLQPGAVGAGLAAEDARRRPPPRPRPPPSRPPPALAASARAVAASGFIASGSSSPATARQASSSSSIWAGNASRKKPETRNVTSTRGRPSTAERQHLDAGHPAGCRASQTGRQPISASACAMSSPPVRMLAVPQADSATWRGQSPCVLQIAARAPAPADLPAQLPGRRRRHGAAVDRIEIAAGRQHVGPAAGRRPARARARTRRPSSPRSRPASSSRPQAVDGRRAAALERASTAARRRPAPARQPVAARPAAGPAAPAARPCRPRCARRRRARQAPPGAARPGRQVAPSGSQSERRDRAASARSSEASPPSPAPRGRRSQRHQQVGELAASGDAAEHVQPVADLQLLELAQMVVERGADARSAAASRADPEVAVEARAARCARGCAPADASQRGAGRARPPRDTRRPAPRARASSPQLSARVSGGVRWSTITAAGAPLGLGALARDR